MINEIVLISSIIIFILVFVLLNLGFGRGKKRKVPNIKKRKSLYRTLDVKTVIYLILAASAVTFFINTISYSAITTSMVFLCAIGLAPFVLSNNLKRMHQEDVFQDVMLYCQNMGMLLKQYHNVFMSLNIVRGDLKTELKTDIESLMKIINDGEEIDNVKVAMSILEDNYEYTCIKNLDLIMLHMLFENAKIDDVLLETFENDVEELSKDVKANKSARSAMRIQYIGISVGCILIYKFFLGTMDSQLTANLNTITFNVVNSVFIFGVLLSLFFIDRYFNAHITKE